jgi:hypothetical protein
MIFPEDRDTEEVYDVECSSLIKRMLDKYEEALSEFKEKEERKNNGY